MTSESTPEQAASDAEEVPPRETDDIASAAEGHLSADGAASEVPFRLFALFLLAVVVMTAYWNALTAGFVWDDFSSVLLHKHVQDPSKIAQLFREDFHAFGRGQGNFYRPLLAVSFMLDYAAARTASTGTVSAAGVPDISPFLFHLGNVFWHFLACAMVFGVLVRAGAPRGVGLGAALLYAVHPLHTEAVTYISGRGDSMAAAFMLLALFCALVEGPALRRGVGVALSLVFFTAALLSKESAAVYPFLLALFLGLLPLTLERGARKAAYLRHALPFALSVVVLAVYALLRSRILNFSEPQNATSSSFGTRLLETGQAFALYLKLIFLPTGLHMERTLAGVPGWVSLIGYLLLFACLAVAVVAAVRGYVRIALGMGWFLIAWFPVSGLIPLNAPMAEHWMYVPLAGFVWALAELVGLPATNSSNRRAMVVAVSAACVTLCAMSLHRNRDWQNDESLYRATLAKNPHSVRVQYNLAVSYEVLLDNPAGARRHFEEVLRLYDARRGAHDTSISDEELEAHLSLGEIYYHLKSYEKAGRHYMAVLQTTPDEAHQGYVAKAAYGLGKASLAMGDMQSAVQFFSQAMRVMPDIQGEVSALLLSKALMGIS